ncbi:MAG: C39 family peptidase, partial [Anaerolineales bacterium]|nr:C39 family peptidase [Anaerolineales bacterium]
MAFQSDLLWQNDPKWAAEKLGHGPQTIKEWGCLMTSLCMVTNGYGYKETPSTFNKKMKDAGGFQGPMVIPSMVPSVFPGVVFQDYMDCEKVSAPISRIDQHLAAGNPAVIQVDWSSAPGAQSHWVVAYAREGDDYLILDPYMYTGDAPGKKLKMLDRYKYQGKDLSKAITGVVFLTGTKGAGGKPADPPKKDKVPVPADPLIVYAAADLAVRAEPNVSGYLYERLKEDDKVTILEDKATAKAKVGQYDKWLQAQAPSGQQGYVAAWFTALEKGKAGETTPPPTQTSGTPPAPATGTGLVVTPTQEGV